jgi:hypothetical protein
LRGCEKNIFKFTIKINTNANASANTNANISKFTADASLVSERLLSGVLRGP